MVNDIGDVCVKLSLENVTKGNIALRDETGDGSGYHKTIWKLS